MTNKAPMIHKSLMGIVGYAASGKDSVADIITEEFGFTHISLSDVLRHEMLEQGIEATRETQRKYANEVRGNIAPEYFVDIAIQKAADMDLKGLVLTGIYSPVEGDYVQRSLGGVLLGVMVSNPDAPTERYSRLKNRSDGLRDNLSYEEFLASHENESIGGYFGTNIPKLLEMARHTIINSGDLPELRMKVTDFMNSILLPSRFIGEDDDTA